MSRLPAKEITVDNHFVRGKSKDGCKTYKETGWITVTMTGKTGEDFSFTRRVEGEQVIYRAEMKVPLKT